MLGRGAVSVFVVVPHPKQVPRSQVDGCADDELDSVVAMKLVPSWSGPRGVVATLPGPFLSLTPVL